VRFDLVVNGGAMFVLSGGVADTTTVDAGGVYVLD
jgi:autotransporter passenger strand-loop-strand repeat protein